MHSRGLCPAFLRGRSSILAAKNSRSLKSLVRSHLLATDFTRQLHAHDLCCNPANFLSLHKKLLGAHILYADCFGSAVAGVEASREAAFVLVAGGLGERLGYSGIKIALPAELASGKCFLQVNTGCCPLLRDIPIPNPKNIILITIMIMTPPCLSVPNTL